MPVMSVERSLVAWEPGINGPPALSGFGACKVSYTHEEKAARLVDEHQACKTVRGCVKVLLACPAYFRFFCMAVTRVVYQYG